MHYTGCLRSTAPSWDPQAALFSERIQGGRVAGPQGDWGGTWMRWGEATAESVEIIWMRGEGLVIPGDSGREVCVRGTCGREAGWITRGLRKVPSGGLRTAPLDFTVAPSDKMCSSGWQSNRQDASPEGSWKPAQTAISNVENARKNERNFQVCSVQHQLNIKLPK